jgi:hypothetical protein
VQAGAGVQPAPRELLLEAAQVNAGGHPAYRDGLKIAFALVALLAFVLGFALGHLT